MRQLTAHSLDTASEVLIYQSYLPVQTGMFSSVCNQAHPLQRSDIIPNKHDISTLSYTMIIFSIVLVTGLVTSGYLSASESDTLPVIDYFRNALYLGVPNILSGQVSLKYEYRIDPRNGLVAGGSYGDWTSTKGYDFNLSYRRHRRETSTGGFWGIFIRYADYESEYKAKVDDVTTVYPFTMTSVSVGPYIGQSWVTTNGLSITARLGYGYPFTDFAWSNGKPSDHPGMVEGIIRFFAGFDGELSIGFCF